MARARQREPCGVPVEAIADDLVLTRGDARVEITLRPFALTVCRGGRRLLRSVGFWVADGSVADQFVHLTEGVIAREELGPRQRAMSARVEQAGDG